MSESIEVIERDDEGHELGRFNFWGRVTIKIDGTLISINAPGYHDPTHDELRFAPEHNPKQQQVDRETFCKREVNGTLNCHHDAKGQEGN